MSTKSLSKTLEIRKQASCLAGEVEDSDEWRELVDHAVRAFKRETQLAHLEQVPRFVPRFGDLLMWVKRQTGKAKKDDDPWIKEWKGQLLGQRLVAILETLRDRASALPEGDRYEVLMEAVRLFLRDLRSEVLYEKQVKGARSSKESQRSEGVRHG